MHRGVDNVVSRIPDIFGRFYHNLASPDRFSVLNLPDHTAYFHDVTGSILIPEPSRISDLAYRDYFRNSRCRFESENCYSRGSAYYRHFVPELSGNRPEQSKLVYSEIRKSLATLSATNSHTEDQVENMLRLAVMDNLRGNVQALYLSSINIFRDSVDVPDGEALMAIGEDLKTLYEHSVELLYSHMFGLPYDNDRLMAGLARAEGILNTYQQYVEQNGYPLKFKNPEIENPIHIAARANELTHQYPDTTLLVGLSSGGVELSTVARLLFKNRLCRDPNVVHYPISTHHGLNMWQADKRQERFNPQYLDAIGLSPDAVAGQKVVICEDNSNSGQTLETTRDIIAEMEPDQVNFAVVEIDPMRAFTHYCQQQLGRTYDIGEVTSRTPRPIANFQHPDFIGAVTVTEIVVGDSGLNKVIAMDTAGKSRH